MVLQHKIITPEASAGRSHMLKMRDAARLGTGVATKAEGAAAEWSDVA